MPTNKVVADPCRAMRHTSTIFKLLKQQLQATHCLPVNIEGGEENFLILTTRPP